jgi:Transposase DDE domain group 1
VGETQDGPFQLSFNSSLIFQGSLVTSDGGLVLVRELDERLGLSELMERHLSDSRRGKNIQLPLADLLRQSIYSAHQLAAAVGEDRRTAHPTCALLRLLLAESHLTRHLFSSIAKHRRASVACGLGCSLGAQVFADEIGGQRDGCARTAAEKHHFRPAGIKARQISPCANLLGLKTRPTLPFANYRVSMRG